jgi:hypothetical protein
VTSDINKTKERFAAIKASLQRDGCKLDGDEITAWYCITIGNRDWLDVSFYSNATLRSAVFLVQPNYGVNSGFDKYDYILGTYNVVTSEETKVPS